MAVCGDGVDPSAGKRNRNNGMGKNVDIVRQEDSAPGVTGV